MINFKDAAKEIIDFEREMFEMEPQMGKMELANQIWATRLNPADRLEIMNIVGASDMKGSAMAKLRKCTAYIAEQL
ncbi:hypothetical protein G5211_00117 [Escherichia phage vB_EcoM_G5211]|uniref:Uncharacterized protein n=1 Tax=Escherichia phage kvi TaxID=2696413 RepID=A0A6B9X225_9CAUD|nr:hypothetical protein G5211_00117 [Escherichia phage vB_EcoM_G5211]QHR71732.1 hypothetical protein kvi_253 [Escherichia phage kvi]UYE95414.1 hypothetical protein [Escherichia phage vB_ESM-pEJ01]